MVRRLCNPTVIDFANHIVLLEPIRNDDFGRPRYEARIVSKDNNSFCTTCAKYRFRGHYRGEREEAEFILEYHLKKVGEL